MEEARFNLTWYRRAKDSRSGVRITLYAHELAAQLADAAPWSATKDDLPLLCTATFRDNHRANANVEMVAMLGLDIDERQADPAAHVARAREALGGVEVFAYSTFSSEADGYKLRLLVPYDAPATGDEHRASWALVTRRLARLGIVVDRACSDPARGFYVWAIPPCGAYCQTHLPGEPWPVAQAAAAEIARRAEIERRRPVATSSPVGGARVERARKYVAKMPAAISGAGGHAYTFAVARKLLQDFELGAADAWAILLEFNRRCEPPWSEKELRHKLDCAGDAHTKNPIADRPRGAA